MVPSTTPPSELRLFLRSSVPRLKFKYRY